jgi:hypothetical protein
MMKFIEMPDAHRRYPVSLMIQDAAILLIPVILTLIGQFFLE